jgi:hypothetical protein
MILFLIDRDNNKHKIDEYIFKKISKTYNNHIKSETFELLKSDKKSEYNLNKYSNSCISWFIQNTKFKITEPIIKQEIINELYSKDFNIFIELLDMAFYLKIEKIIEFCLKKIFYFGSNLYNDDNDVFSNKLIEILYNHTSKINYVNCKNEYIKYTTNIIWNVFYDKNGKIHCINALLPILILNKMKNIDKENKKNYIAFLFKLMNEEDKINIFYIISYHY